MYPLHMKFNKPVSIDVENFPIICKSKKKINSLLFEEWIEIRFKISWRIRRIELVLSESFIFSWIRSICNAIQIFRSNKFKFCKLKFINDKNFVCAFSILKLAIWLVIIKENNMEFVSTKDLIVFSCWFYRLSSVSRVTWWWVVAHEYQQYPGTQPSRCLPWNILFKHLLKKGVL